MNPLCFTPKALLATTTSLLVLLILSLSSTQAPSSFRIETPTSPNPSTDDLLQHAANRTLGFQKIFVINLPSRSDRRDAMSLTAAFSGLQIEYVDGVANVAKDHLPPGGGSKYLKKGDLGAWRAHMNVLRKIVEDGITSALVLEDDADWDIRIKSQMQTFAKASRLLLQPLPGTTDQYLDPTFPQPTDGQQPQNLDIDEEVVSETSSSPYGDIDRWDLLWLGHCGGRFPRPEDTNTPLGRAIISNDPTVPEPQHIDIQFGNTNLVDEYPPHTRVVSHAHGTVCTLAYGITQPGARRFLYDLGIRRLDGATDLMFRNMCDGAFGRKRRTCLTVQPQLFQHHRPVGRKALFSDIQDHGDEWNDVAYTRNIRWSARGNLGKLVDGETEFVDLYKDGEEADDGLEFG